MAVNSPFFHMKGAKLPGVGGEPVLKQMWKMADKKAADRGLSDEVEYGSACANGIVADLCKFYCCYTVLL